jgi:hypothetical protein
MSKKDDILMVILEVIKTVLLCAIVILVAMSYRG